MNNIKCIIEGCNSVFTTPEPVAAVCNFICKNHDIKTQAQASKRVFNERTDLEHQRVTFQPKQFDPDLSLASSPEGTSHIKRQGSNTRYSPPAPKTGWTGLDDGLPGDDPTAEEDRLIEWIDGQKN